jgi:adenosine deaminase
MLAAGLLVTVNSDDPAYFGGYINENFLSVQQALSLSQQEVSTLARNSFVASFLPEREKVARLSGFDEFAKKW